MRIIDLYAGSGGMTRGFTDVYKDAELVSVELHSTACKTHRLNFPDSILYEGKVSDHLDDLPPADLVIGGPPCQMFSKANAARRGDPGRAQEWMQFMEACARTGAKAFVMENVQQLRTHEDGAEWQPLNERARELGYTVVACILNAADYGASTRRLRLFTVGIKGEPWRPPAPTHCAPEHASTLDMFSEPRAPWRTVRDAIGDLPEPLEKRDKSLDPPMDIHFLVCTEKYRELCKKIPLGVNRLRWLYDNDRESLPPVQQRRSPDCYPYAFGAMEWDEPSFTLTTGFIFANHGCFTHPNGKRVITLREGARITGYPDHHKFTGGKTAIARQIGNSVCPPVARAIAESLRGLWE